MSACERCRRTDRHVAESLRLGQTVCWYCYHEGFTDQDRAEVERVERQSEIAKEIRRVAGQLERGHAAKVRDLALLIELDTGDGVDALLAEVDRLGVEVVVS